MHDLAFILAGIDHKSLEEMDDHWRGLIRRKWDKTNRRWRETHSCIHIVFRFVNTAGGISLLDRFISCDALDNN